MISPQEALIYTMVVAAESDGEIADAEIDIVGDLANHLPVFAGIDRSTIAAMAARCSDLLARTDGADRVFGLVREALSLPLRETAYALACDVIAVDRRLSRSEMGVLERIRAQLDVDPAMARSIEQVAQVRFQAA